MTTRRDVEGTSLPGAHAAASGAAELGPLIARAKLGDRNALEAVVEQVQDRVYNLAIRMLWHPADAENATKEILIRIVTHLAMFRGESAFMTWVYRIATNCLLTTRKRRAEREELTFARFGEQLDEGLAADDADPASQIDRAMLVAEIKIGCTQGMLLCLDRDHRLAYILGDVFGLSGRDAAECAGITRDAHRKRLSRARSRLHGFMRQKCGLVNPASPCRCARRVDHAVAIGRVDPDHLLFAGHPASPRLTPELSEAVGEMEQFHRAAELLRGHPEYLAPGHPAQAVRALLDTSRQRVLIE